MFTPFSFWHKSVMDSVNPTLLFAEPYDAFFGPIFNPLVATLEQTEPFTGGWFDSTWTGLTPTLVQTEPYTAGWFDSTWTGLTPTLLQSEDYGSF
jgi:hypothetical protein